MQRKPSVKEWKFMLVRFMERSKLSEFHEYTAMDAIKTISDWLYWQKIYSSETRLSLANTSRRSKPPNSDKIREAAAKLKAKAATGFSRWPSSSHEHKEDYWKPLLTLSTPTSSSNILSPSNTAELKPIVIKKKSIDEIYAESTGLSRTNTMIFGIPLSMAVISSTIIGFKGREASLENGLQEHIGGHWALEAVISFELQVVLAGITWFFIGLVIAAVVGFILESSASRR